MRTSSNSPQAAFERCLQPFSPTLLFPTYPQIYPALLFWAVSILLGWGTCRLSPPPCCCLFFDKGTEVDDFEAPQVGLVEIAATGRPDVVAPYFIRQVPRWRPLMREVHPWLEKVESSLSLILFHPTSDMQYPARGWTPSPVSSPPAGGDRSRGGARKSGRAWVRGCCRPGCLSGGGGTEIIIVESLLPRELFPDEFLHLVILLISILIVIVNQLKHVQQELVRSELSKASNK